MIDNREVLLESFIDLTKFKESEEEKTKLETQLRHAQKMEAIGTLAGGIAHDFNNILTAVLGYTELALLRTGEGADPHDDLIQVLKAANRAKDLVKQILAFSRHSEGTPKPTRGLSEAHRDNHLHQQRYLSPPSALEPGRIPGLLCREGALPEAKPQVRGCQGREAFFKELVRVC